MVAQASRQLFQLNLLFVIRANWRFIGDYIFFLDRRQNYFLFFGTTVEEALHSYLQVQEKLYHSNLELLSLANKGDNSYLCL